MANVSNFNCALYTPNTGFGTCNVEFGLLQGFLALPRGTRYTKSQLATLMATLTTAANQGIPSARVFPIGRFVAITDSSTDTTIETTDYGVSAIARDGMFNWKGRTMNGGYCLYKSLRKFHGKHDAYDLVAVFKNGMLFTYYPNATTGAMEFGGVRPSMIDVPTFKLPSGTAAAQYWFGIQVFDSTQWTDNGLFVQTAVDPLSQITGIADVDIQNDAVFNSSPAGSVDILPVIACGGASLIDIFGTTLNSASLYVATNTDTNAAITITGVSTVAGKVRIQLDTTDTDYPLTGGKVNIKGAAASVWYGAGIIGYETNIATVTRP